MTIEKLEISDYERVHEFYFKMIDGFAGQSFSPKWEKDVYPAPEQLKELLENGEMYAAVKDGELVSVMAYNHDYNEGYDAVSWPVEASGNEVFVIHMLGVLPEFSRQGVATQMLIYARELAAKQDAKAIRLDVLKGNKPANRLYESFGFKYISTLTMFYPDTGNMDFELYEKEI